jgi:hypothetical protein
MAVAVTPRPDNRDMGRKTGPDDSRRRSAFRRGLVRVLLSHPLSPYCRRAFLSRPPPVLHRIELGGNLEGVTGAL